VVQWVLNDSNQTRWSWVEEGATSFIKTIRYTNGTKVAIISFGKVAYIRCPFQDTTRILIDSLKRTIVAGGTLYDPPFLDPKAGALYMFRTFSTDIHKRRIVVFLTDGEPNIPPSTDSLIRELHNENVTVYGITLCMPMNVDLAKISAETGGKAYAVYSKKDLNDIYSYIALDIQRMQFCSLIWDAPYGCTDLSRTRKIEVTFKPLNTTLLRDYNAPSYSIGKVDLSDNIVSFGDPNPTNSTFRYLTFSPKNSPLRIDTLFASPSTYFSVVSLDTSNNIKKYPFTIDTGQSHTIQLKFTQGAAKGYRQASLIANGSPCPPLVPLVGGISQIRIIYPNGGEIFSTCDNIIIQWAGIDPTTPVNLAYSSDNGVTWKAIANNVTNFSYTWKPPQPGVLYRIRGVVAPVSQYVCAQSEGGTENDVGTSIACVDNEFSFYVTGHFEATASIQGKNFISKGGKDLFIAKYDRDCNPLWVNRAGGTGNDSANGVCHDPDGNAWVTGTMMNGAQFGSQMFSNLIDGVPYCFLAKYPKQGWDTPAMGYIGATPAYNQFKCWGLKVRYIVATPPNRDEIWVQGRYIGSIQNTDYNYSLPKAADTKNGSFFTAIFYPDMTIKNVTTNATNYPDYSSNVDFDVDGNRFETGCFTTPVTFGAIKLTSKGRKDVYISKFGGSPGSQDLSDTTFKVESPQLTLKSNNIDFKDCTLGGFIDSVFSGYVCNFGTLPITISNATFLGVHAGDFSLGASLVGQQINPGACIPIEIIFTPKDIGARLAQLNITDACSANVSLNLMGNGICSGIVLTPIDFKNVTLNVKKDSSITCLFKNSNPAPISVKPQLEGTNAGDFKLSDNSEFLLNPNDCIKLTISFTPTVPGLRTATIRYVSKSCDLPVTELMGFGIDADVSISGVDWHGRRIMTQNDSTLNIRNNSITSVKILGLELQDKSNTDFEIVNNPVPLIIKEKDSFKLNVRFNPKAETVYNNTIMMMVENRTDTLLAPLTGEGILPKIETKWICDQAVKPGEFSIAYIEVSNPSTTSDLVISSMIFKPVSADFNWDAGVVTNNVIIPMQGMKSFNVRFTPQAAGNRTAVVKIYSDAAPGPEQNPSVETSVPVSCDGMGLSSVPDMDFGSLLLCDNHNQNLTINNTSGNSVISLIGYYFEGADSSAFSVKIPADLNIPPNSYINLNVIFNPTEKRNYSTKLHVVASSSIEVVVTLNGAGDIINLFADPNVVKSYPGLTRKIPVKANIGAFTKPFLNNLAVTLRFDTKMVQYVPNSFKSNINNWNWNTPDLSNVKSGILKVNGTGTINLPFNADLFTCEWKIFLNEFPESNMFFTSDVSPCVSPEIKAVTIGLQNVCFMNGTLVVSGKAEYALLAPQPNPASNTVKLNFGVGLDGYTSINIYNSMGELVRNAVNEELKSGEYQLDIPVNDLSSGVYLIKMVSGQFMGTESLIINK